MLKDEKKKGLKRGGNQANTGEPFKPGLIS